MSPGLDISLRQEVMSLRKKVVMLETAESDNERLRKEMARLRIKTREEQSKFELDFMNQLSEVARENAIKVDLITDELRETKKKNLALSEQLRSRGQVPERPIPQPMNGSDPRFAEVESLRRQLQDAKQARDNLVKKLDDRTEMLREMKKEFEAQNSAEMKLVEDENRSLRTTIASLERENEEMKVALNDFKSRHATNNEKKDTIIAELQKQVQLLKISAERVENESRNDLQAELSSTKDLLAHEKDFCVNLEKDLNTKMQALHETLNNSETSRASLAHDNERLIAQATQITEEKIQLEQKSKRQHQQLKKLQQLVEGHLYKVDKDRKDDDMELQHQRDQVEQLTRELVRAQEKISLLEKTIEKKDEKERTNGHLAKLNLDSIQTQLNKLQNEVTLRDTKLSEEELRHKKEIISLETALDSIQLDLKECQDTKDKEIEKLKMLAEEKMNEARALERGKEQLVLSMQDMVKNRQGEVDDYQNELVEMNTRLTNETRKVSTLRSRLEQSDYPAKKMGRLRKRIAELSRQLAIQRESEMPPEHENRQLRIRLKEALVQRSQAEDRLQRYLSERGTNGVPSKSVEVLRQRNEALKNEVERLTRKLEKLSGKPSRDSSWNERDKPCVVRNGVTRMMI